MRNILLLLVVLSLIVRGTTLYLQRASLDADPDAYRQIAENLRKAGVYSLNHKSGEVHPTAFRPPLYPLMLAAIASPDGNVLSTAVLALHLVLGIATVLLTFFAARQLLASDRLAFIAAVIVLLDPILLRQQALVMTETIATFLAVAVVALSCYFAARPTPYRALALGVLFGIAILCRPTFLPWLVLAIGALCFLPKGESATTPISAAQHRGRLAMFFLAMVAGAMVTVTPWINRNSRHFKTPIVTTTHGGYTLLLANNPVFYEWLRTGDRSAPWMSFTIDAIVEQIADDHTLTFSKRSRATLIASMRGELMPLEIAMDKCCREEAQRTMRDDPAGLGRAILYRWWQLVSPLPNALSADESPRMRMARYGVAVWYVMVGGMFVVGLASLRTSFHMHRFTWLLAFSLLLSLAAIHSLYWANLRMRAPAMPVVAIVAAASLARLKMFRPST